MQSEEKTVQKETLSPGQFLAAQRRFLHLMYYDNHKVDIEGQLACGQYATAGLLARMALEQGIAIYILRLGELGFDRQNAWPIFRRVCGENALFEKAARLMFRNPMTPEEVRSYAEDVFDFVEHSLDIHAAGYHSKESFDGYALNIEGITRLAALVKI